MILISKSPESESESESLKNRTTPQPCFLGLKNAYFTYLKYSSSILQVRNVPTGLCISRTTCSLCTFFVHLDTNMRSCLLKMSITRLRVECEFDVGGNDYSTFQIETT